MTDDPREFIEPGGTDDVEERADEHFVHGLLGFLHGESEDAKERRIGRLMEAIERDEAAHSEPTVRAPRSTGGERRSRAFVRVLSGVAALLLIALLLRFFDREPSAKAIVRESIDASLRSEARRYEFSALHQNETAPPAMRGQIDIADPDHIVIRLTTPLGIDLVFGRNEQGEWLVHGDNVVERFGEEERWPRWVRLDQSAFFVESVDSILLSLHRSYDLRSVGSAPIEGRGPEEYQRVTAYLATDDDVHPGQVELWIDPETRLLHRMELSWPHPDAVDARRKKHSLGHKIHDWFHAHMRLLFGGHHGHDERQEPREPERIGRDPAFPDPDTGQADVHDREAEHARAVHRAVLEFLHGNPRFVEGFHAAPRLVVFDLVEEPVFADDWFSPEAHTR